MRILIGCTIPAFKMTAEGDWWHWLENAEQITERATAAGHSVSWLAVLQEDGRGREPFAPLFDRIDELAVSACVEIQLCSFSLDNGERTITSGNRLVAICTGRNLIIERALRGGHDWIYFVDADISAPDDVLTRLLELDWPVCGAHVPTYCLDGPPATIDHLPGADVRRHWNTAGSLLVARDVFRRVPWRYDPDAGQTDDPATQAELERLGWPTLVRHDVVCAHHPASIGALEDRGHDLSVYR